MELNGKSLDIKEENIKALKQLFPEVECDGKIDFDMLRQILGEYVDDDQERYNFKWNGKGRALRFSQTTSTGTLRPCKEESKNWEDTQNLYIEGDNLEVLKILQKSYYGKIKMIYIDPPYNTGNDFVYPDNYRQSIENYKEITGQTDEEGNNISTNTENNGRFHTDWLNMMYPRLRLARNLLTDDGVIFISIDDNEVENLKKICNEIFGENNFIGQWNWFKSATPPNLSKKIKKNIEYVICYEKNKTDQKYKGLKKTSPSSNGLLNQTNSIGILTFPEKVVTTKLEDGIYTAGEYGTSSYQIHLLNDAVVKDGLFVSEVILKSNFKWSQQNLLNEISKGTKIAIQTNSFSPSYEKLEYDPEVPPNFIDKAVNVDTTEQAGKLLSELMDNVKVFDYPKPVDLLKYLINFICNNNDIIVDFFSGSATTAHAVMQLNAEDGGNRKFIMVQLPEPCKEDTEAFKAGYKNICEIGKERIRRAGEKIKEEITQENSQTKTGEEPKKVPDTGFKVFKLDSSNLKKWNPDFNNIELSLDDIVENYVPGRSETDIVYEFMLKMGLDLSYPVETTEIEGKKVYTIGCGALMMCLDDDINVSVAEGMVKLYNEQKPETWKVVFKDNGFKDDCTKANVKLTLVQAGLEDEGFATV